MTTELVCNAADNSIMCFGPALNNAVECPTTSILDLTSYSCTATCSDTLTTLADGTKYCRKKNAVNGSNKIKNLYII